MGFLSQIAMPEKITFAIVGAVIIGVIGGRLFMRFVYNIFLRYFDNIEETMCGMKADIKKLYDRTDNYNDVSDTVAYCKKKNRKK